jgi:hypothetical protein
MNSASLGSLAGRYENPIPPRCLAPIDFLKIPAQYSIDITNKRMYVEACFMYIFTCWLRG